MEQGGELHWRSRKLHREAEDASLKIQEDVAHQISNRFVQ